MSQLEVFEAMRGVPGFPRIFDDGRVGSALWCAMELLGPSLRALHDRYTFDEDLTVFVADQMLERLEVWAVARCDFGGAVRRHTGGGSACIVRGGGGHGGLAFMHGAVGGVGCGLSTHVGTRPFLITLWPPKILMKLIAHHIRTGGSWISPNKSSCQIPFLIVHKFINAKQGKGVRGGWLLHSFQLYTLVWVFRIIYSAVFVHGGREALFLEVKLEQLFIWSQVLLQCVPAAACFTERGP